MKATLTLNLTNDAATQDLAGELERIFRELAKKARTLAAPSVTRVRDVNGNQIGDFALGVTAQD